jgi:hypothetical protein
MLSSDAQQTTLPGGHDLSQESTEGAIRNCKTWGGVACDASARLGACRLWPL